MFYMYFYMLYFKRRLLGEARHAQIYGTFGRAYLVWKLLRLNGVRATRHSLKDLRERERERERETICWLHCDETTIDVDDSVTTHDHPRCINRYAVDIGKQHVDEVFYSVFGYRLCIDPNTYSGPIVKKSNRNAAHDGQIISGPVDAIDPDYVYLRLIDNQHGNDLVIDYRPLVIGNEMVYVYCKYRPLDHRFLNTNKGVNLRTPTECFSESEIDSVVKFCKEFGADVCELDVLRDNQTQKIYIVDVNTTPHSPPDALLNRVGLRAMRLAANSLRRQYLRS
ncbi:MAG: hypothetical protein EA377_12590 [Phycisphaerales bacterium]|nr:MAG: hypothetical protein EA377_12590 [Phycisphaerales bacterium]